MKRINTEDFIQRSIVIHGDRYDYSKSEYVRYKTKLSIICKIHGEFLQSPSSHLAGRGCKKCSGFMVYNTADFVNQANLVHNYYYDYSESVYIASILKLNIICLKHGLFKQTPNQHLAGSGCIKCGYENTADKNRSTQDKFIINANLIHHNLYDYSKAVYFSQRHKIIVICSKHGEFIVTPNNHLNGKGCPVCGVITRSKKRSLTTIEFILKANYIHNHKYDYTKVNYINNYCKIIIKCPKHGDFLQKPQNHLCGKGCPSCSHCISKIETKWLDSFNNINIVRHVPINIGSKIINVDGFDRITNTIYEFYGDFWHGNPAKYKSNDFNNVVKKEFGVLYNNTMKRENILKQAGYNIITIWENEFRTVLLGLK